MSINFLLHLATTTTAEQLATEVHALATDAGLLPRGTTPNQLLQGAGQFDSGMLVRVRPVEPPPWDPVLADLEIAANAEVAFQYASGGNASQENEMLRLVLALLERVGGDAVLHFDYDHIWLLRRDGALSVSDDDGFWTPQRLALLPPHHRTALTFP